MATLNIPDNFIRYFIQCAFIGLTTFAAGVSSYRSHYGWKDSIVWPGLLFLAVTGLVWQAIVSLWVPEPYLDEFFHIPQAQKYCELRWDEWDDKITTPPGLYVTAASSTLPDKRTLLTIKTPATSPASPYRNSPGSSSAPAPHSPCA